MKKLLLAGLVAASVLVGTVNAAGYKIGYVNKNSDYKASDITCDNGQKGTIFYYFNRDNYPYVVNVTNTYKSFDEAANLICNQIEMTKIVIKEGALIFKRDKDHVNGIVNALTHRLNMISKIPLNDADEEKNEVFTVHGGSFYAIQFYPKREVVIDQDGNVVWNILPSEAKIIKKYGYKKVMLVEGYYALKTKNGVYFVAESEVDK